MDVHPMHQGCGAWLPAVVLVLRPVLALVYWALLLESSRFLARWFAVLEPVVPVVVVEVRSSS